jgi:hypothetical protein
VSRKPPHCTEQRQHLHQGVREASQAGSWPEAPGGKGAIGDNLAVGDPTHETAAVRANTMTSTQVRGVSLAGAKWWASATSEKLP